MPDKKKVTSEDVPFQVGKKGGGAKKAAQAIEARNKKRGKRLSAIEQQLRILRGQQTTDFSQ